MCYTSILSMCYTSVMSMCYTSILSMCYTSILSVCYTSILSMCYTSILYVLYQYIVAVLSARSSPQSQIHQGRTTIQLIKLSPKSEVIFENVQIMVLELNHWA